MTAKAQPVHWKRHILFLRKI